MRILNHVEIKAAACLLAAGSCFANADVTSGGDVIISTTTIVGNTGYGWYTVDGGTQSSQNGSMSLGRTSTAEGVLTVQGVDTHFAKSLNYVGEYGDATVNVFGGGEFRTSGTDTFGRLYIGRNPGSHGSINVSDVGSLVAVTDTVLGLNGDAAGTLYIADGGMFEVQGFLSVQNGSVDVSGGDLFVSESLSVSRSISQARGGSLFVDQGGSIAMLDTGNLNISNAATFTGGSAFLDCGDIHLSSQPDYPLAQCFIQDGAAATLHRSLVIQSAGTEEMPAVSELIIEGANSIVSVDGYANMSSNSIENSTNRIFVLDGGHLAVSENLQIERGSGLSGDNGTVSVSGDLVMWPSSSGGAAPFIAYQPVHADDPFVSIGGNLQLNWTGALLSVPHNTELTVSPGDEFMVIDLAGEIVALHDAPPRFANFEEGDLVDTYNGIGLFITYQGGDGNDIVLYAIPCPADFTGDGTLDIFDVFAFLDLYNAMDPDADFTGDGSFDIFDVFAFLEAYNAGCPL